MDVEVPARRPFRRFLRAHTGSLELLERGPGPPRLIVDQFADSLQRTRSQTFTGSLAFELFYGLNRGERKQRATEGDLGEDPSRE